MIRLQAFAFHRSINKIIFFKAKKETLKFPKHSLMETFCQNVSGEGDLLALMYLSNYDYISFVCKCMKNTSQSDPIALEKSNYCQNMLLISLLVYSAYNYSVTLSHFTDRE